ncbi:hypothetical protein JYB87_03365 [Shewanella avicenniae]|uniref:ABC transporter permease n=1 Tax=Shewanella avicenniae TaxID=2814294 RepID=A0ABX7QS65_9GAMM|nr:hypothetical protein [Shewanella avicenniae]QSX34304.1 hypothetical protein JYB87_03365 [Shewanella avicenniae]
MHKHRRYRRSSQLLVWALVAGFILLALMMTQADTLSWIMASPLMWFDESLWSMSLAAMTVLLLLCWVTAAFSLMALATLSCSLMALVLLLSGASLLWPIMLILLAVWGFNRALQQP